MLSGCFLGFFGGPGLLVSGIGLSDGTISPAFDPDVTEYEATVPYAAEQVDLTITSDLNRADITVDGSSLSENDTATVFLDPGMNTITIVATAGGESRTYTVSVNRFGPEIQITGPPFFGDADEDLADGTLVEFGLGAYFEGTREIDFTITNLGNADLVLSALAPDFVVIDPAGDSEIYVEVQPIASIIGPGGTEVFTIAADTAGVVASHTSSATIPNNDPDEGDFELNFTSESDDSML